MCSSIGQDFLSSRQRGELVVPLRSNFKILLVFLLLYLHGEQEGRWRLRYLYSEKITLSLLQSLSPLPCDSFSRDEAEHKREA